MEISQAVAGHILLLDGIEKIAGNLVCQNAGQLTAFLANDLTAVNGVFGLNNLTILSSLNFPRLVFVNEFEFISLPAIRVLNFTAGVTTNTVIVSNTQLNNLDGLEIVSVDVFNVNNNPYMSSITIPFQSVNHAVDIAANARDCVASFPDRIAPPT